MFCTISDFAYIICYRIKIIDEDFGAKNIAEHF